ncbi:MAG: FAD:protein FMN transferase [Sphingomonadales bacterium]|nr:FAD:protein FMN transferase [Sphingomonadales bacterium]
MTATIRPSRRRLLQITAAVGCAALAGVGPVRSRPVTWYGRALGADARIALHYPDEAAAGRLIDAALDEVTRLERIFSLYRPDSALARLNRQGALDAPPPELVQLMAEATRFSRLTDGAFDITVQPLWALYADHFAAPDADPAGPSEEAIAGALAKVDYRAVEIDSTRIAFAGPGMAVTLNGIAQGFITDRVSDLLKDAGLTHVLVNLGEIRALGPKPDGAPWRVGLPDGRTLGIERRAVATSAGSGTVFDSQGRHHHIFDPTRGHSAGGFAHVTVAAPTATEADALSTGLAASSADQGKRIIDRLRTRQDLDVFSEKLV